MKQTLKIAVLMTIVTTVLFGLIYPLVVTGLAQVLFPSKANGSLIYEHGTLVGSRLLGQAFTGAGYFHSRPSGAGDGYDAANSGSANLGPTNHALLDRVKGDVARLQTENPGAAIPVDLVTSSASGLDPDISPDAAEFQIPRVAKERGMDAAELRAIVAQHTQARQFGILGEPRVNVLELNLELQGKGEVKK
ncbi:MAG TPA: potassium-transporting ATPase subunit KdpC [Candidatus Acidoferrum sp.]|nr:potassium-transporting ATPase subunit KdpC [Candidatus Acidoferrum sp.]